MVPKLLRLLSLTCFALVISTCSTSQNASPLVPPDARQQAPSISDLTNLLHSEFARLGIDPSKVVAAAPGGSDNAVFDLSASILGDLGIELTWTERIIGDYDQNGEVNLTDITPLVLNWVDNVAYDDPALHGGFDGWPEGDADSAGAANWRKARIDGDSNGEINTADITPIALHFHQSLDGYRVYRKAPGEAQFTMMPPPVPVDEDVTLAHPDSPDNTAPVRYSLSDDDATPGGLGDGVYQYYVAPYDKTSGAEGAASGIVHVDIVAGTVNQSPVAQLSITPGFAGAPAEITLDASASYDPDGTVAAYEWDFDADGVVDWLSTDPLPDESSSGTVDSITEMSPGVVTATYHQGSDEYFYPSVVVVDAEAAQSNAASSQLGLTGWKLMQVSGPDIGDPVDFELPWRVLDTIADPDNGEFVILGSDTYVASDTYTDTPEDALFIARAGRDGIHSSELIIHMDDERFLQHVTGQTLWVLWSHLAWETNGQQLIFLSVLQAGSRTQYFFLMRQEANSEWTIEPVDFEYQGKQYRVTSTLYGTALNPGVVSLNGRAVNLADSAETMKILLHYRHGEWIVEDQEAAGMTVFDARWFAIDSEETLSCQYANPDGGVRWVKQLGYENWEKERLDEGQFDIPGRITYLSTFCSDPNGTPWFFVNRRALREDGSDNEFRFPIIVVRRDGELTGYPLRDFEGRGVSGDLLTNGNKTVAIVGVRALADGAAIKGWVYSFEVRGNSTFSDELIQTFRGGSDHELNTGTVGIRHPAINAEGEVVTFLVRNDLSETSKKLQVFCSRLDPRL